MGTARSIRRKAEREKAKRTRPKGNVEDWSDREISQETGAKLETISLWLETAAKKMESEMSGSMAELLWEAEEYMATANVVIMLHAILMTFGHLKTVQKGMGRLFKNYTIAIEKVDDMGIAEAYEQLRQVGIDFEFEDFDISRLFDEPGQSKKVVQRMKAKWRERK